MSEPHPYNEYEMLDLMEKGTRYEHYQELKELFECGITILKNIQPHLKLERDAEKQKKLEIAVEMIEKRLEFLARWEFKQADLRRIVRESEETALRDYYDARARQQVNSDGTNPSSSSS